jgi:hypothetical protein
MIIHEFYFTPLLAPYSLRVFCWSLPKSGPIRKVPCAYPFSLVWNPDCQSYIGTIARDSLKSKEKEREFNTRDLPLLKKNRLMRNV